MALFRSSFGDGRLAVLGAALLLVSACHRQTPRLIEDEAMVKAKAEHLDPEKVRKSFYYHATEKENFFQGMDAIATVPANTIDLADELARPDSTQPPRTLADSVSTPNEILGRNTWMLWCGGNEAFWDWLANNSLGFTDLIKLIDSRNRSQRWKDAGIVNEPGMRDATKPDEYGLWIDQPDPEYYSASAPDHLISPRAPSDPAYPADSPEAKSSRHFAEIYGWSTGVVGLRLFKNPAFKGEEEKKWKSHLHNGVATDYYAKESYFSDPHLIRPYRVGMSCAFCHASAHPLDAPLNPAHPRWENLSGAIGSQYLRVRAIFGNLLQKDNFVYQVLDSQPPGTIDTSLIASDNINNANTMNAIFAVPQRVQRAYANPPETLSAVSASMPSLDRSESKPYEQPRHVPRILLDGADSIGVFGALARVYLNIGTFPEKWNTLHTPLVGFLPPEAVQEDPVKHYQQTQAPFRLQDCHEHSIYWLATQDRVEALRDYFLKIAPSMPLRSAVGSSAAPPVQLDKLARGRQVFAANCIVCHSSIQPENNPRDLFQADTSDLLHAKPATAADQSAVDSYLQRYQAVIQKRQAQFASYAQTSELWDHDPGQWLRDPDYQLWAKEVVETPQFWRNNYLSTDFRIPVTYVRTNPGRALGTNGMTGRMWQDFTSEDYRHLPSVGAISYFNPFTQAQESFTPRQAVPKDVAPGGGGPGYYRPTSLVSVWATAPLLHNNSLGLFNNDPSVRGRLEAYNDAIQKLLWPQKRLDSSSYNKATAARLHHDHGLIWRTTEVTYLNIPAKNVPAFLAKVPIVMTLLKPIEPWLQRLKPYPWLPSALLLVLSFIFFLAVPQKRLARTLGYLSLAAALLLGGLLYLAAGGLGDLRIGPIPKGTPVDLLANLNPDAPRADLKNALTTGVETLAEIESRHLSEKDASALMRSRIAPALLKASKCPDFVMDKGHYFPWFRDMTDDDKRALIELLKTF